MGFDVINKLSEKYNIDVKKEKLDGIYGSGTIENEKVINKHAIYDIASSVWKKQYFCE